MNKAWNLWLNGLLNEQAGDVEETAAGYLNEEVTDVVAALAGAHEILAQWVSDNATYREFIRKYMRYNAILKTKLKKEEADPNKSMRCIMTSKINLATYQRTGP